MTSVLKNGLAIRYSVNEQATGRFEVLLASSIARKLGLKGQRGQPGRHDGARHRQPVALISVRAVRPA